MNLALVPFFVVAAAALRAQHASYRVPLPPGAGWFGSSIVAIPDIDRDGVAEIAVGAPHTWSNGRQLGAVYLYSGRSGRLLRTLFGDQEGGRFGYALDTIPDVNGDGIADLIVSSPSYYQHTITVPGFVRIISPVDGTVISETPRSTMVMLGYAVAAWRDFDHDGAVDFLASHQEFSSSRYSTRLYSGRTGNYLATVFNGAQAAFSTQLHARTDFDLDGVPDIVIGDHGFSPPFGRVVVLTGATRLLWWQHVGTGSSWIGAAVGTIPDRNGDGVPEVTTDITVLSGRNGTVLPFGWHGTTGAAIGDVDQDGVVDYGVHQGGHTAAAVVSGRGGVLFQYAGYLANPASSTWPDLNRDGLGDFVAAGDGLSVHLTRMPLAGVTPFGAGCPGLFGVPTLSVEGRPTLGSRITLRVDGIRPMMPGAMVVGGSRTSIRGVSLPFDLGPIGMQGCWLHVSDELVTGMQSTNQFWSMDLDVPIDVLLVGRNVYAQHFHIDPGANARGLVSSNGMEVRVGH